ncbi:MAG: epoxyqueuosine reductase QueH [Chloroflexi bacterium]|nr:epoxyqueuosine reductase QueH [Chloroflexota bacterium]
MPLLLHTCCAPCATYTVKSLREEGIDPTAFWYNPNIHPFSEHDKRLETLRSFAEAAKLELIAPEGYDMPAYFRAVVGHEERRCPDCYRLRLRRTAIAARDKGFLMFSTTLLISPFQQHEKLIEVGEEIALEEGVEFYYRDFRRGYHESRQMAREMDLYRQKYCGCVYSEWERHSKRRIVAPSRAVG